MNNIDCSILLVTPEEGDPEAIGRTLSSLAPLSTNSNIELIVLFPKGAQDAVVDDAQVDAELTYQYFGPNQLIPSLNEAYRKSQGRSILLITAGTMVATHSAEMDWASLFESDNITVPQLREIRPIVPFTNQDLKGLAAGGLATYPGAHLAEGPQSKSLVILPRRHYWVLRGLNEEIGGYFASLDDFCVRARQYGLTVVRETERVNSFRVAQGMHADWSFKKTSATTFAPSSALHTNLRSWVRSPEADGPLISVVITTYNRADYLNECINSILVQTFQDFEVIMIDDGSIDGTADLVKEYNDERIRYFYRSNAGIASARNFGTTVARGAYIAVHDDDDLMLPWRLEVQLASMEAGIHGNYGVSVHFDNESGATSRLVHRRFNMQTALKYGHNPTHPTWLVRTDIFNKFEYDETLKSGVDNNLALRMLRSGVNLKHTGEMLILRRVHGGQITRSAGEIQNTAAKMARQMLKFANGGSTDIEKMDKTDEWLSGPLSPDYEGDIRRYLPDHLVRRFVYVTTSRSDIDWKIWTSIHGGRYSSIEATDTLTGSKSTTVRVTNLLWSGLADLASKNVTFDVFEDHAENETGRNGFAHSWIQSVVGHSPDSSNCHIVIFGAVDSDRLASLGLHGLQAHVNDGPSPISIFLSRPLPSPDAGKLYAQLVNEASAGATPYLVAPSKELFDNQFEQLVGRVGATS